jgi:type III secretion system low calcium response chaperone LcrH/SycD
MSAIHPTPMNEAEAAQSILRGDLSYRQLCGITPEEMESAYASAYTLYQAGKYADAERIFQFLALFDSHEPKYWLGLGGCREALKNTAGAAEAYLIPLVVDTPEPQAALRAAICCEAVGRTEDAVEALKTAVAWASTDPGAAILKAQAESMLNRLIP